MWLCAAGLWAGTLLGWEAEVGITKLALAAGGVAGVCLRRRPAARLAGAFVVALALGQYGAAARSGAASALEAAADEVPHCKVAGSVLEDVGALGTLVAVEKVACDGLAPAREPGIALVDWAPGEPGSAVAGEGWLVPLGEDRYDVVARRAGANARFLPDDIDEIAPPDGLLGVSAAMRGALRRAAGALEERRAGLLLGITVGDTAGLDHATIESFRRAGLSHLLAVSGTNVAIVLGAVAVVARSLSHRLRVLAAAAALVFFVLVVGPEPSVLRAAAMGAIGLAAMASGRRAEPLQALGFALIAVVGARPALVFSAGLHLSAAATAGIVLWTGPVSRRLRRLPRLVALPLGATLAAQFAVAPLLVGTFGELSLAGPGANLLAAPAVAPATVLGLLAGVAGAVDGGLGHVVAGAAGPFAGWMLWVGDRFGGASWASLELPPSLGWVLVWPVLGAAAATLAGARLTLPRPAATTPTTPRA